MSRFLMPLLFLIAAGGLFFTWIDPRYQEIKEDQQELVRLQELDRKATTLRDDRMALLSKYQNISDAGRDRLYRLLPDHADNVQLLLDIKNAAATYGIVLKDIKLESDTTQRRQNSQNTQVKRYGETGISFGVEARYAEFVSFLRDIEQSLRLLDIKTIEVSTAEDNPDVQTYTLSVTTYWLE